jgi:hypothetical protein
MTGQEQEPEIHRLFKALRSQDSQQTPSFEEVAEARHANKVAWSAWGVQAAFAVVLVGAIAVAVMFQLMESRQVAVSAEVAEILVWDSPTDFLIDYSDEPLFSAVPEIEMGLERWDPIDSQKPEDQG